MQSTFSRFFPAAGLAALLLASGAAAQPIDTSVPPISGPMARLLPPTGEMVVAGGAELEAGSLRAVYAAHDYQPLWPAGIKREKMLLALSTAERDGLESADYLTPALTGRHQAAGGDIIADEFDLLLTDALLRYSRDLRVGRVTPQEAGHDWRHPLPVFDAAAFVAELAGKEDALSALDALAPPFAGYRRLRQSLQTLRELEQAGGWPAVAGDIDDSVKLGHSHPVVPLVRRRLAATGEYAGGDLDNETLDEALSEAVKRFQENHGLDIDGVIGRKTLAALKATVADRIGQVIANMERWRWLPRQFEPEHLIVNIGGQYVELVRDGQVVLHTRTVVGLPTHRTTAFKAAVSSVTLNPPWNVPYSIASKEILPALKRDPDYLIKHRLQIVGGPEETDVEGVGVDWQEYSQHSFPYRLRQDPGVGNSLGRVKFNMPNRHDIYLHDTPSRHLFQRGRRAFSHGCVRVQDPLRLAATLIDRLSPEDLQRRIEAGGTQTIPLKEPVPIYLFYFTAWVDADDRLQLREDVYDYDRGIVSHLEKRRQQAAITAKN